MLTHILAVLSRMEGSLSTLAGHVSTHTPEIEGLRRDVDRHEEKISELEQAKWKLVGASAGIGGLIAVIGATAPLLAGR